MTRHVLELVTGGFTVRVGVGKSGIFPEFVCTAWRLKHCRQVTHQTQAAMWIVARVVIWVWSSGKFSVGFRK